MQTRIEVTKHYATKYAKDSKKVKNQILDTVVELTGWHQNPSRQQLRRRLDQPKGRAHCHGGGFFRRENFSFWYKQIVGHPVRFPACHFPDHRTDCNARNSSLLQADRHHMPFTTFRGHDFIRNRQEILDNYQIQRGECRSRYPQ